MLRIKGSPLHLCSGWTRRDVLWAGGLGLFGVGLSDALRLQAAQPATPARERHFGKAKSCILIHLYGSPSQLETVDMKPNAPEEIRGEFKPIRSSLPGLDVCELMPHSAKVMDRTTVLRSLTHPYPIHGVAFALTGIPQIDVAMELSPRDPRHYPFIGSVVDFVLQQREGNKRKRREVPDNIALPFPFSSKRVGEVPRAGPYAAYLGSAYNPIWTEFRGDITGRYHKTLAAQNYDGPEPYVGVGTNSRFEVATATQLPTDVTIDRLDRRRSLLEQFDLGRRDLERSGAGRSQDHFRQMAYSLIGSEKIRQALDVSREPLPVRDQYGLSLFGQSCLAARRLVEAGSRFVSVFWDEYGLAGSAWDTHWQHFPRMKEELMPGFDRGFAGLIADLDSRGLLDETLVVCVSEHGRTPKLSRGNGGGRDHWSMAYSGLFAGGGVARGRVVGKSDKIGGQVHDRPTSPKDVLATIYHLLGIDPHTPILDRLGRPMPLLPEGQVVQELLA